MKSEKEIRAAERPTAGPSGRRSVSDVLCQRLWWWNDGLAVGLGGLT
jgi:hypothetical protein